MYEGGGVVKDNAIAGDGAPVASGNCSCSCCIFTSSCLTIFIVYFHNTVNSISR